MTFETALRLSEILLALAFLQQSAEHLWQDKRDKAVYGIRLGCCIALFAGYQAALIGLVATSLFALHRFQGPYNGGSDRMGMLVVTCVGATHLMPTQLGKEVVFGYLGVQLTLSYFFSGKVKLLNPSWRSGQALQDVFAFSAYPVMQSLRVCGQFPFALWMASWGVILFEVLFPFLLFTQTTLLAALGMGVAFHFANACIFGLNRFLWIWLAAYPPLIWLQGRLVVLA